MVLRGGSEQFIDEAERSLHDAIMIVRRAIKNASVVAGGGAIDMEISRCFAPHIMAFPPTGSLSCLSHHGLPSYGKPSPPCSKVPPLHS